MSLTVAQLAAETRSFVWHYIEDIAVTYRPGVLTLAWNALEVKDALAATLVALDVLDDKGEPIALDAATLGRTLPVPVMRKLAQAIYDDSALDPTPAGTSGGS